MMLAIWLAAAALAIALAGVAAAWKRGLISFPAVVSGLALAVAGAAFFVAWNGALDKPLPDDRGAERPGLALRIDELSARALAPHSPLACLDAAAGPKVEAACEALIFSRPETIAAAVAYVSAKLALFSGAAGGDGSDAALTSLRRGLEADRFGIVAHVLSTQSECNAERCNALALLGDSVKIRTNLNEGMFDQLVARHAGAWPTGAAGADAARGGASAGAALARPPGRPLSPRHDFPSAASIPPVSIMDPEPTTPPPPPTAAPASRPPASVPPAASAPAAAPASRPAPSVPPAASAPAAAPPADASGGGTAAAPPLPPRRPPAPRAAQRPAGPMPLAPAAPAQPAAPGEPADAY